MTRHLLTAVLALSLPASLPGAEETRGPLKVLFLGDSGQHRPADRAALLIPVLAGRGIDVTYSEKPSDLDPYGLRNYDALIVYADIETIDPRQERALLDYVATGGGFVPIHCAASCFRNSPGYAALVGARLLGSGEGEFDIQVVAVDHPIMKGLRPFRTWDETYVHQGPVGPGRHVLQVRAEGDHEEPWTWVRTRGQGRIFYTAYGHDVRTWGHPGFHDLIERGIRWASGKGAVLDSGAEVPVDRGSLPSIAARAAIPNYLPIPKWGTQGEPGLRMQAPAPASASIRRMALPRGFEVKLFAAEPEVTKPIAMAWDHRGRLWIAESTDYPNGKQRDARGGDRIKICADTDGDGRADRFTVFAEGLNIPTSLAFAAGGVVVHQAPDTLLLRDIDGDDKADVREVLFTGWGVGDTHAGPSNLRWGFDNWLYGIVGYAGFKGMVGGERLEFRQGIYRFRPDGTKLEFLRSTSNNSWGLGFSEEGLIFGSTANGCPSVYLPLANRDYERVRGGSAHALRGIAESNRFFPITDKIRQVDFHGGFTAAAGHALYTARAYPKHYWNRTAFVAEPTGHLVATFVLQAKGSDFAAHQGWNLIASEDEWTAPIAAEVGPDGNVWVIDWYNFIVQHNPTPRGFKTGKGNAYETPLRDKTFGRIYRIVPTKSVPPEPVALDPDVAPSLLAALTNDNLLWRLHAQRLLVEQGRRDVIPGLIRLVRDRSLDPIGLNAGAIHALWTLHGLSTLDGSDPEARAAAVAALKHPSAAVRRNALLVLPRDNPSAAAILDAGALRDDDAHVRLAALIALSEMPASETVAAALVVALVAGSAEQDRWLGDGAVIAAVAHDRAFLRALAIHRHDRPPNDLVLSVAGRVAEHCARGRPAGSIGQLLAALPEADLRVVEAILAGLDRGWPEDSQARLDDATEASLALLWPCSTEEAKGHLLALADRWGSEVFAPHAAVMTESLLAKSREESTAEAARIEAARRLIELRRRDPDAARRLLGSITLRAAPSLAAGLIEAIGRSEAPGVGLLLVDHLASLTPGVRPAAIRVLLSRGDWTSALLDAIEKGAIRPAELSLDQRQALVGSPDRPVAERARRLLGRGGLPDPDRQKVIDGLASVVLWGGEPARGKAVYRQHCARCHTHAGEGGKVGPDLTGIAAVAGAELLVSLLDPSRNVEGNFVRYSVATTGGRVLSGLLASETRTAIEVVDAEGKVHVVPRAAIEELVASRKSLMPEGFEKLITAGEIADLLAFLSARGKYLPLDLRPVATANSTRGMFTARDTNAERLVFPDWSPKMVAGVPFQLIDPRGDRVPNVVLLYGPKGTYPPRMPRSVALPCHTPARSVHLLGGVSGWGFPSSVEPSISMIVRLHYVDGEAEDHALRNGIELADYIRPVEVPGSTLAFTLGGRQVRYLKIRPRRPAVIETIELVKGPDGTAPVIMAVTVETATDESE